MTPTNLPGAPTMPADLIASLARAVTDKGPSYVPRTRHKDGNRPRYTNRLVLETSPYLLQHAHNPVNWYPWGDEAFEEARRSGKPVFLSIGYSTCHWCHVMEEESFEDEEIAAYLNQHFVCIKVDREERPDVDAVYMAAVQGFTGSGGWPMSVWLNGAREPFFAGTYFPPRDGVRGARTGFLSLLGQLHDTWVKDPARVKKAAESLARAVRDDMEGRAKPASGASLPDGSLVAETVKHFRGAFDPVWGGVRRAPKFPSNLPVRLLLRHHRRTGDPDVLGMATLTLVKMAAGGIYDQVGGGFHRYSTDEKWLVPHFEKMLYDNALLALTYAEAYQATGRADFARVTRETLDYLLREMRSPEGAFYSATDADSEGEEGRFFVWSLDEIRQHLGAEAGLFASHYGVTAGGNFEGHNILWVPAPDEAQHAALSGARKTLYDVRAKRIPPLRDEKILSAWNGLAISGFAVAGRILGEPRYVEAAAKAADFLLTRVRQGDRLARSYKDGRVQPHGFIEDQAFVTAGLLDLYEASFEPRWLEEALRLAEATQAHFADTEHGGWFTSAKDGEVLLAREKPAYDGAEPSGTSVAMLNALRLAAFTSDDRWGAVARAALTGVSERLRQTGGLAMTEALLAVDFLTDDAREVALVWPAQGDHDAAAPLLEVLRSTFLPNRVLAGTTEGAPLDQLAKTARFVEGKHAIGGKPTAYVCERGRCEAPTTDPAVFEKQLGSVRRP